MYAIKLVNTKLVVTQNTIDHVTGHSTAPLIFPSLADALLIKEFLLAPTHYEKSVLQLRWLSLCQFNQDSGNILCIKDLDRYTAELQQYRKSRILFAVESLLPNADTGAIQFHDVCAFPFNPVEAKIRMLTPKKFVVVAHGKLIASSDLSLKDATTLTNIEG